MTTNRNRAAALIEAMIEHDVEILAADPVDTGDRTHGPGAIAQALADGGLLAPDLPEANDTELPHAIKRWVLDAEGSPVVWTAPGGRVMIHRIEPGDLTPDQARTLALVLRAAATYSEGDHDD